jgi:hypothetical protein
MSIFANAEIASERVAKRLSIEFDKSTKPHPLPVKVQSAPQPSSPPVAQKKQSTSNPKPQPEPRRNVAKLMGMMSPEHNSNGNVAELCEKLKAIEIGIERSRDLSERANLLKEEGSILLNLAFELAGTENASAVQSECCTMSKNSLSESGGIYKKLGDSRNLETVNSLTETANAFSEDIE